MKPQFCCAEMEFHLHEEKVAINYDEVERAHSIDVRDGGLTIQRIKFCPWCGSILPRDLKDEFYDIIFDELNLEGLDDPNLPEEFKSDEWWRKRGL